jgi:hypothetical protein
MSLHSTTNHLPFKIIYGFNPLTHLGLLPLYVGERVCFDGNKKAKMLKKHYKSV